MCHIQTIFIQNQLKLSFQDSIKSKNSWNQTTYFKLDFFYEKNLNVHKNTVQFSWLIRWAIAIYLHILVYSIQHHSSYQTKFKEKWIKIIVLRTFSYDNDNKCALKRLTKAVRLAAHL